MLSDRSYMRDDYPRQTTSVVTWLLCATATGFILQHVFLKWLGLGVYRSFMGFVALTPDGLLSGKIWTAATYALLHSPDNLLHLLGNMLGIFFIGRIILPILGSKRFMWLYIGGVAVGGLFWAFVNSSTGVPLLGASAGVAAMLVFFAALDPNRPISVLLFFIIPVSIKPKWLVFFLLAFDLLGFFASELPTGNGIGGIAHSAHLGGFALGWIFFRYVHKGEWVGLGTGGPSMELPGWMKRSPKSSARSGAYKVNVGSSSPAGSATPSSARNVDLKDEVDRILDKINVSGFGALTDEEKRILDRAKDQLNRR